MKGVCYVLLFYCPSIPNQSAQTYSQIHTHTHTHALRTQTHTKRHRATVLSQVAHDTVGTVSAESSALW